MQFDDSDSVTTAYLTKAIGTTCWMAPEVMQGDAYGLSADIYSFSIVLWEILTMKVRMLIKKAAVNLGCRGRLNPMLTNGACKAT